MMYALFLFVAVGLVCGSAAGLACLVACQLTGLMSTTDAREGC